MTALGILKRLEALEKRVRLGETAEILGFKRLAFQSVISAFSMIPELRGFWPTSLYDNTNNQMYSVNGQNTLTENGTCISGVYNGLVPFVEFNSSSDYLSRADNTSLSITGSMAFGGWFWCDNTASVVERLIGKYNSTGNLRSYDIARQAAGDMIVQVSVDGTTTVNQASGVDPGVDVWTFLVGRFQASTELALFQDGIWYKNTSSIPASIYDSTAPFTVAIEGDLISSPFAGRASMMFVSSALIADSQIELLYDISKPLFE